MSSSMDPGPKLRLLTNVLLLSDRSGRSRTLSPPLPPFRPRQAVGLVGILVSRSRELEIAVGTVFGFDDRLNRLLRTLENPPKGKTPRGKKKYYRFQDRVKELFETLEKIIQYEVSAGEEN